jgi:hypothetical protein
VSRLFPPIFILSLTSILQFDWYVIYSGGFFAGKVSSLADRVEGRFDPTSGHMGAMYRARYLNDGYFEALKLLKDVAVCSAPPVRLASPRLHCR